MGFRRHFYQHAGFRYVSSDRNLDYLDEQFEELKEANKEIYEQTHFQYSDEMVQGFGNHTVQLSNRILNLYSGKRGRVLDVGCTTGRSSFEFAKHFDMTYGLDRTTRLVGVGCQMKELNSIEWNMETEKSSSHSAACSDLNITPEILDRIEFWQEDSQNISEDWFVGMDLVVANENVLNDVANPMLFLSSV